MSDDKTISVTDRQLEVLRLRSHGLTLTEISVKMDVSPETIKTHMAKVIKRLNAANSTHAVGIAMRAGLIR